MSARIDVDDASSVASLQSVPCALVIGNFDGVHRGHQEVLEQAVADARASGRLLACALTFDPHPGEVVGSGAPPLLTSLERRVELMGALGIARVYVRLFDRTFAAWPPERFARDLVAGALAAKVVVVGQNFRLGAKRGGDLAMLHALGRELGFEVRVPAVAGDARGPYSSTRVRDALAAGDLVEAAAVLGRPHAISGVVVHGEARGRTLGFPTANLEPIAEMLPRDGVYAARAFRLEDASEPARPLANAVVNIGLRPTVDGKRRTVEAHLLKFQGRPLRRPTPIAPHRAPARGRALRLPRRVEGADRARRRGDERRARPQLKEPTGGSRPPLHLGAHCRKNLLMKRAELESLDRDNLIARAEAAGVTRARILTRPELVDELLLRMTTDQASKQRARGLFGRARDLLARVVERGLHLPDAAERIRALGELPERTSAPAALPTVTLAEIYAAQGHRARAVETLEGVLSREPDHAAARALVAQLRDATYPVSPPRLPPEKDEEEAGSALAEEEGEAEPVSAVAPAPAPAEPSEPTHMLDDSPLPTRYDVDECVAIPVDPTTLYVYWELRDLTLEYVRVTRPGGTLVLRALVIVPGWDGPRSSARDHDVDATLGDFFVRDLPAGSVVRVAIGYRLGDAFVPIAHSPALETPPGAPSPLVSDSLVRWTPHGLVAVARTDGDAPAIERAVIQVRREAAVAARELRMNQPPLGSSELWAVAPWATN